MVDRNRAKRDDPDLQNLNIGDFPVWPLSVIIFYPIFHEQFDFYVDFFMVLKKYIFFSILMISPYGCMIIPGFQRTLVAVERTLTAL